MRPLPLASWGAGVLIGTWLALDAPAARVDGVWALGVGVALSLIGLMLGACQGFTTARAVFGAGAGLPDIGPTARRSPRAVAFLACAGGALLAWGAVHVRTLDRLDHQLPRQTTLGADAAPLDGWWPVLIDDLPTRRTQGLRLRGRPLPPSEGGAAEPCGSAAETVATDRLPRRIQVSWTATTTQAPPADIAAGQVWCLPLRLKPVHGAVNPVGFDVELWLLGLDIGATGSVRGSMAHAARRLREVDGYPIARWRQQVRDAIAAWVPDRAAAGVLAALAVGDQASIEADDWAVYRRTGVAHLMAISGVHVTMFAWLAGGLAVRLWRRSTRALTLCPAGRVGRWAGVAAAAGYALLSGWGVPAQRTVWMLLTWAVLRSIGIHWGWPRVLMAAAVLVVLVDPWALRQAGFYLSFCAVALLMGQTERGLETASSERPAGPASTWREALRAEARTLWRVQWLTSLVLAPLGLLFFGQVSLVGLLANLVAIPWVTWVLTPLALLGTLWGGAWWVAAHALTALMAVLDTLSAWPWATWQAASAPVWLQGLGCLGGLLLAGPWPTRLRALGLPLILAMAFPASERPDPGGLTLWSFDIGQGNAVLLQTRHHAVLFDAGPAYGPEGDAGERVLLPQLRALGVPALDLMVLSHRDTDHVGGAASILDELPVHRLLSSLETGHPLRARAPHQPCVAGQSWVWDGVHFEILHPDPQLLAAGSFATPFGPQVKPNSLSCVLSVRVLGRHVLLTGDIERPQELALIDRAPERLPAEILMVPHHGSRTSSSQAFLEAVRPGVALVQAGHLNRYGHPAPDVLERYRRMGAHVIRADRCGAWRWDSATGQGACLREEAPRAWRPRPSG